MEMSSRLPRRVAGPGAMLGSRAGPALTPAAQRRKKAGQAFVLGPRPLETSCS